MYTFNVENDYVIVTADGHIYGIDVLDQNVIEKYSPVKIYYRDGNGYYPL